MNELTTLKLEGQLCKYTNVMRGYQFRYFVVDASQGKLDYFMSEDMKHQRPRSSIQLHGAVISPSDEDSTTFMVYTSDNEMFKLRAQDAKERQRWVNVLRLVAQSFNEKPIERDLTPKIQTTNLNQNGHSKSTNDIKTTVKNEGDSDDNYEIPEKLQLIAEILSQVQASQELLEKNISTLPLSNQNGLSRFNKDVLLLKATSEACVNSLGKCCNVLNVNKTKKKAGYVPLNSNNYNELQNSIAKAQLIQSSYASQLDLDASQKSTKSNETVLTITPASSNLNVSNNNNNNNNNNNSNTTVITTNTNTFLSHTALNINPDDELTDDEQLVDTQNSDYISEYNQIFDDNKSLILHVLSNLKLGMDLTKISLPTFILEKRSLLELFADCMTHPDLFLKISDAKTAEDRMIAVLDWYLTSFHQIRKGALNKKPYNPIVGETFHCSWKVASNSETTTITSNEVNSSAESTLSFFNNYNLLTYCAEQVSHHPPVTAFYFECEKKKIKLNASIYTQSKFLGMSIGVSLVGRLVLKLDQYNEEYVMTLPSCFARSILTHPWIELGDKVSISCQQTGYTASIVFHVKPFYGENSNQVTAEVKDKNEEIICKVQGAWSGILDYQFTDEKKTSKTIDTNTLKQLKKRVRPIKLQNSMESRRLWQYVSQALAKADIESATNYKNNLEMQQRTNEKVRTENNIELKAKYFIKNKDEWLHQNWLI